MEIFKLLAFFIFVPFSAECANVYFHTDSYRSRSDSPFISLLEGGITFVEDFETQGWQQPVSLLTTPNATGWNGLAASSPGRGVQEDYTQEDPSGSRWANNGSHPDAIKPPSGIHFDFTPDEQGRLPEYAGAALLGRYDQNGTGLLYNSILVYDFNGIEVTDGEWKFVRPPYSEIPDDPADYFLNFYGIHVPGGISSIRFLGFDEVDHLTYGYTAIPEPGVPALAGIALIFGLGSRRRRLFIHSDQTGSKAYRDLHRLQWRKAGDMEVETELDVVEKPSPVESTMPGHPSPL